MAKFDVQFLGDIPEIIQNKFPNVEKTRIGYSIRGYEISNDILNANLRNPTEEDVREYATKYIEDSLNAEAERYRLEKPSPEREVVIVIGYLKLARRS